ncbi:hypothetical protein V8G61_08760 [Gaetbulibacter sp. M240]|uniref:hypothetical protein n=1 Tax=Gaetbulibacter sp. M240 TaxID=3126511 RepID=UPI00374F1D4F
MRTILIMFLILLLPACNSSDSNFKLCGNKKYPYYHPDLSYEGGFYEIKRHFYENYSQIKNDKNTGIVQIQFQVNCIGDTGNYKVSTYSLEYKNTIMDETIIHRLLQLTKGLKKWIPAVNDNGENINSHKFFAFKLIDGKLIDILPK